MEGNNVWLFVAIAWMIFFPLAVIASIPLFVRPWLRAAFHGTPISLVSIVSMRLRGNPPLLLIDAYIALKRAGIDASIVDVENAYIDSRTRVKTAPDLVALVKQRAENAAAVGA